MTNMWTTQQKIQNVNEEHGLTDNRRVDVQNLVSKRRGWGLSKRGHLSLKKFHFQKVKLSERMQLGQLYKNQSLDGWKL